MLLKKKLVRMGYERGLSRWHYYGDCSSCAGRGCKACNDTGAGKKWHPHLNVLIEEGYVNDIDNSEMMTELRAWVSQYFRRINITRKPLPVVIHYSYCKTDEEAVNRVKYITRSTFRIYNRATAKMLYGYNSTSSWGRWNIEINEEQALDNGCCPLCLKEKQRSAVKWFKLNTSNNYTGTKVIHLQNGQYYAVSGDRARGPAFASIGMRIKGRARQGAASFIRRPGYNATNYSECAV